MSLLLAARCAAKPAHLPNSNGHNAEEAAKRPQWQLSYHMLHADAACRTQATYIIRRVAAHKRGLYASSVTCGHVRAMPSYQSQSEEPGYRQASTCMAYTSR